MFKAAYSHKNGESKVLQSSHCVFHKELKLCRIGYRKWIIFFTEIQTKFCMQLKIQFGK